jgi:hypothetical protein
VGIPPKSHALTSLGQDTTNEQYYFHSTVIPNIYDYRLNANPQECATLCDVHDDAASFCVLIPVKGWETRLT